MIFKKNEILTLNNNVMYTILEVLDYKDRRYLYLVENNENEELLDKTKIVYVIKDRHDNYGLRDVVDNEELTIVSSMFIPMLEHDYSE